MSGPRRRYCIPTGLGPRVDGAYPELRGDAAKHDAAVGGWWARVWPVLLAVGTVGAVGVPAAVASYRHARDVIADHGDPVMAPFLPLSVDGMLVAALVVIWVRRHRGDRAGAFPWCAFGFGMVVTVLANLAAVQAPSPVTVAVALFPPLALAVTLELVALIAYRSAPRTPASMLEAVSTDADDGDVPAGEAAGFGNRDGANGDGANGDSANGDGANRDAEPAMPRTARRDHPHDRDKGDPRVHELAGVLAAAAGRSVTGAEVAARFHCSPRTGRRLLAAAQDRTTAPDPAHPRAASSSGALALVTAGAGR